MMRLMKAPGTALIQFATQESKDLEYPEANRAHKVYASWMSGYTPEEIAKSKGLEVEQVEKDLEYVSQSLPVRTLIAHGNDRSRILLQREQSDDFRRLMKESLEKTATDYIKEGLSPAGALREFREAVGMVEKPGTFVTLNQAFVSPGSVNSPIGSGAPRSAEDLIRKVLKRIEEQRVPPTLDTAPIDIEAEDSGEEVVETEDSIPDDND